MTSSYINGLSGAAGTFAYYLAAGTISTRLDVGAGRLALDGTRPMRIIALAPWIGGYSGPRVASVFVGNISSGTFSVPSGGASSRSSQFLAGSGYLVRNTGPSGTSLSCGYNINGSSYFGWNSQAGNSVSHSAGGGSFASRVLAGSYIYELVPTAARTVTASQIGITSARVEWVAPSDDGGYAGLTGYRIQAALDDAFTIGVISLDVGTVSTANMTGLQAGANYRFRVLSRNGTTIAAGTYGPASNTATLTMIAETGNIDSWQIFGTAPAGVEATTAEGIRRATVSAIAGTPSALLKESNVTAAPVTLDAYTYGAKREIAGLTIGKVYRLTANAAFIGSAINAETPAVYALGIHDLDVWAAPGELVTPNLPIGLPTLEFTATATTHAIAFVLAEAVTKTTATDLERFAIWDIALAEVPSFSPYRLQSIVYESNLANHFDLANNSVGARWWVDVENITQFAATLGTEGALATFTDERGAGLLEYTDIQTSLDTRNVVNDLTIDQHGAQVGDSGWIANDQSLNYTDLTSIATNSIRQGNLDMSLYDEGSYEGSLADRVAEIFHDYANPVFTITGISWNAQEDPEAAARLDVYSPIDIVFRGETYPLRIVNMKHKISPNRWMIDLELDRR